MKAVRTVAQTLAHGNWHRAQELNELLLFLASATNEETVCYLKRHKKTEHLPKNPKLPTEPTFDPFELLEIEPTLDTKAVRTACNAIMRVHFCDYPPERKRCVDANHPISELSSFMMESTTNEAMRYLGKYIDAK